MDIYCGYIGFLGMSIRKTLKVMNLFYMYMYVYKMST